jgi:hypothetical protein
MWSSIISLFGSIGIIVALVWVTTASMRLLRAFQLAKGAEMEINSLCEKLEEEIAKVVENRTKVTGEIEKQELTRDKSKRLLEQLEADLSPEAMQRRERHYVLADRRAPNESEWLIPIACPSAASRHWHPWYMQSWAKARSYLCWAPNAEAARRMADSRFPPNGGFVVGSPSPPPLPLTPVLK